MSVKLKSSKFEAGIWASKYSGEKTCQNHRNVLEIKIGTKIFNALIDSGSQLNIISESLFERLPNHSITKVYSPKSKLVSASGDIINEKCVASIRTKIGKKIREIMFNVIETRERRPNLILGATFLYENKVQIDHFNMVMKIEDELFLLKSNNRHKVGEQPHFVMAVENSFLEPNMSQNIYCKMTNKIRGRGTYIISEILVSDLHLNHSDKYSSGESLVTNRRHGFPFQFLNNSSKRIFIRKGKILGIAQPIEEKQIFSVQQPTVNKKTQLDKSGIAKINLEHLDEVKQSRVYNVLKKNSSIFVEKDIELKEAKIRPLEIDVGDARPIKQRAYTIPFSLRDQLKEDIDNQLENGIIRPSHSPWSSPCLYVNKKDGTHRLVVDLRKVNDSVKYNAYPLPIIDEVLSKLGGCGYYTVIDLKAGFWQIPLKESSKEVTAFVCPEGLFEFNRLPFGLKTAPGLFQEAMHQVLGKFRSKFVMAYLDDLIIYSKNFEDHLKHIHLVLERLAEFGIQIKPSKCKFFMKEVLFLGHIVSRKGIQVNPSKVDTVRKMPPPSTVKEVRSFLGTTGYYRKFIKDYGLIAHPLFELTKKNKKYDWTQECQVSFDTLKKKLCEVPILMHPDHRKRYIIHTDASEKCVGAVLLQEYDGIEKPISYLSYKLNTAQAKYSAIEREALAIVTALKKWRIYLYGTEFTVKTDHKPIKSLFTAQIKSARVQKWAVLLSEFNCKIEYKKGKDNFIADMLSRIPNPKEECQVESLNDQEMAQKALDSMKNSFILVRQNEEKFLKDLISGGKDFSEWQKEDPELYSIISDLDNNKNENFFVSNRDKRLYHISNKSRFDDEQHIQLVIPKSLRLEVIENTHLQHGHFGIEKTYANLKTKYYWPGMYKETVKYVENCDLCTKNNLKRIIHPLGELPMPNFPFDIVGIDLVGPFVTSTKGNNYLFTLVDHFSGWCEVYPIPNKEAKTVCDVLFSKIFPRHGVPTTMVSDRGTEFCNSILDNLTKLYHISKIKTSPYHAMSNGTVERFHRELNAILRKFSFSNKIEWEEYIPHVLLACRNTINSRTKHTPFFIMYGRDAKMPLDTIIEPPFDGRVDPNNYLKDKLQQQTKCFNIVKDNTREMREKNKIYYDKKTKDQKISVGDLVFYFDKSRFHDKLDMKWQGKYRVIEKTGEFNCRIRDLENFKCKWVHVNDLRLANPNTFWENMNGPINNSVQTGEQLNAMSQPLLSNDRSQSRPEDIKNALGYVINSQQVREQPNRRGKNTAYYIDHDWDEDELIDSKHNFVIPSPPVTVPVIPQENKSVQENSQNNLTSVEPIPSTSRNLANEASSDNKVFPVVNKDVTTDDDMDIESQSRAIKRQSSSTDNKVEKAPPLPPKLLKYDRKRSVSNKEMNQDTANKQLKVDKETEEAERKAFIKTFIKEVLTEACSILYEL